MVRFAAARRVNEVFVNGADPRAAAQCSALRTAGIGVSCLGGDPRWVLDPRAGLEWSRAALRRSAGTTLHLDVEPWTLPEWEADVDGMTNAYADFVERCARDLGGVEIVVDIVPWLFSAAPQAARRVLRAASSVVILAYRDRATAILELAAPAVDAARTAGRRYRIGAETMPVGPGVPAGVTFADDGDGVLRREIAAVHGALAGDRWYAGVAVHHWASWRRLPP